MSEENSFNVIFGNKTDVGKVRQRNEDYMECFKSSFGEVFIVCDGMGGHEGGEIASRLAVATIRQIITANPNGLTSPASIIEEAVSLANKAIISKSEETNGLKGMGTTCVVLIVRGDQAFYGHVGDSRIYLVRGSHLYLMSRDHSFVQGLVDQGLINWEEAESHPRKNEITQALGIFEKINPEVNHNPLQLYKGDKFILCSDGLSGPVPESLLLDTVLKYHPVEASNKLVETANSNGGPDNITVQIIEIINAEQLPSDKISLPPEGSINRSSLNIHNNSVTKEFSYENPEVLNKSKKKSSVFLYVSIIFGIIVIAIWIKYYVISKGTEETKSDKTKETSKVEESQKSLDSLSDTLYHDLKTSLKELYNGKSTPIKLQNSIKISNDFYYQGSKNSDRQKFSFEGLIINIQSNELKYNNITKPEIYSNDTFKCELNVQFGEKENIYDLRFIIKEKKFVLQSISFLRALDEKRNDKTQNIPKVKKTNIQEKKENKSEKDNVENKENTKDETKEQEPVKDDKSVKEDP